MIITEQDRRIEELTADEYFYLTENLEYTDKKSVDSAVKFLVCNKKRKLLEIVKAVMENELDENERSLALDYWDRGMSLRTLAAKHGVGKSSVGRSLENIKAKLKASLKYVLLYDENTLPQSAEELLNFVKKENSFES